MPKITKLCLIKFVKLMLRTLVASFFSDTVYIVSSYSFDLTDIASISCSSVAVLIL